tara:strand:- start:7533 stop:7835 length:303 start_codon:yes stop_codon:yes gene_type:complete
MKKLLIPLALAACTEVNDFYPNADLVMIDDREFFVIPAPGQKENVYNAGLNKPPGSALVKRDFALPASNIAAIEVVTGCKVQRETVYNTNIGSTFAAVNC